MYLPSALPLSGSIRYTPAGKGQPFGRIIISGDKAELRDFDCRNVFVSVIADDVVISGCRFNASGAVPVDMFEGKTRLTVEKSIFDGERQNKPVLTMLRARDGVVTVRGCVFQDIPSDGITCVGGVIDGNVFRGAGFLKDAHADGVWVPKTVAPVTISNNEFDWRMSVGAPVPPNNAIRVVPEMGDIHDVLIENNMILGGTYAIAVCKQPHLMNLALERIIVRRNRLAEWMYGPLYPLRTPRDLVYEDNTDMKTGKVLPR